MTSLLTSTSTCSLCACQLCEDSEEREALPPAKRSCPLQDSRKKVTFNPKVQETVLEPGSPSKAPKPVSLKEVADIVVRCLDPFYTQGKFATKVRERGKGHKLG